jgi:hypothetical protein
VAAVGRGYGRGPGQLRFRALVEVFGGAVDQIPDSRREASTRYSLRDYYLSGLAMFFLQDSSLLEFQRRIQDQTQRNNLSSVFGVQQIPSDSQMREVVDQHSWEPLRGVFREYLRRAQRSKVLEQFQFLGERYLVTLDGSEYFRSEALECPGCLRCERKDGRVEHYHQILQPALVRPGLPQVLPLAPEFIRAQDGANKQDCETNAGKRLIRKIRQEYRQLSITILGDSLYSTGPFVRELELLRYSYLLTAKPESHQSLFEDIEGLRGGGRLETLQTLEAKGQGHRYEWVNGVPLGADPKSPLINFVQMTISNAEGKQTYCCSWVTDIELGRANIVEVVRGARARWKIENEGFNTLKNQGYHLEHNFGHGKQYLSESFFLLNLLAFLMHQIFQLVDGLYQIARARFSARREYWNTIRGSFQVLLFDSWDQVLERLTGPPTAAFPK